MRATRDSLFETRVSYERWGSEGPRVLLVHPIGFDRHSWEDVIPRLSTRFQVAALDLPGHGESDKPARANYGLWALGARVERFLDELGWEDAIVVGNSLGGGVALSLTLQAPQRVRGLTLVNSVGFRSGLPLLGRLAFVPLLPLTTAFTPRLALRLGLASPRREWWKSIPAKRFDNTRQYLRSREGRGAFFLALRHLYGPDLDEMAEHYGEIHCPTLVLHGERDPLIRLGHAARLATAIPSARLEILPHCGHFPQEECPEETLQHLRRFLRLFSEESQPQMDANGRG